MSDLQKILAVLDKIQNDINLLNIGMEVMNAEVGGIKEELRTMKDGTSHSLDSLSNQFHGVVRDFETFGLKFMGLFDKWSKEADSRVANVVLDVHGPRIKAMENKFHEIKAE